MFGIAVMAASVPQVTRGEPATFIAAYIWCRLLAAGSWKRTSRVMTEWPGVQQAAGVIPWIASLGTEPPVRYWLWTAGIVLDVVLSVVRSRNPAHLLEQEQAERDRERRNRVRRNRLSGLFGRDAAPEPAEAPVVLEAALPDRPHRRII
jgi:hypothetical protein